MAGFPDRDDECGPFRFPSCGPVFSPHRPWPSFPPPLPRSVNYRALAEDLDVFAKGPVESTLPDRAGIRAASAAVNAVDDMPATGTGDWFPNRDDLLRLRTLSSVPEVPASQPIQADPVAGPERSIRPVVSAAPDTYATVAGDHTASLAPVSPPATDAPRPGSEAVSTGAATVSSEGPMITTIFGPGGTTTTDTVANDGSPE